MKNQNINKILDGFASGLLITIGIPALITIISMFFTFPLIESLALQLNSLIGVFIAIGIANTFKDSLYVTFSIVIAGLITSGFNNTNSLFFVLIFIVCCRFIFAKLEQSLKNNEWILPILAIILSFIMYQFINEPLNQLLNNLIDMMHINSSISIVTTLLFVIIVLVLFYLPFAVLMVYFMAGATNLSSSLWLALFAMMVVSVYLCAKTSGVLKAAFLGLFAPWFVTKVFLQNGLLLLWALFIAVLVFILNMYLFEIHFEIIGSLPIISFVSYMKSDLLGVGLMIILLVIILPLVTTHFAYKVFKSNKSINTNIPTL